MTTSRLRRRNWSSISRTRWNGRRTTATLNPANAIIIYAWNENDEGGWLIPTLSEGTARLDAIARVLNPKER